METVFKYLLTSATEILCINPEEFVKASAKYNLLSNNVTVEYYSCLLAEAVIPLTVTQLGS